MNITIDSRASLLKLADLWAQEKLATRRQEQDIRDAVPFEQRVSQGIALDNLRFENSEAAGAGRCQLWFHLPREGALENAKINVGDPIVLWTGRGAQRQSGVVGRRGQSRLSIIVNSGYASFVEQEPLRLDLETSEVTFERGEAAIARFLKAPELTAMRELLFGEAEPTFGKPPELSFRDEGLNTNQRDAVRFAMGAEQIALIHGPPGTGKTRTLVEVVRQQLRAGRSVLVTAASNTAVDHLTRQLIAQGVKPLRLGHPARVAEDLRSRTAEALMEDTEEYQLARKWQGSAQRLRERLSKSSTRKRGTDDASIRRKGLSEANQLNADARRALKEARAKVLRRSRIVCTTAAGADSSVLGHTQYDVVVVDEATQAPDPIALAALQRGRIGILAGDPCQLSPTVIDIEAAKEGLSSTLFERASRRWKAEATHLLEVQYRMHATLMRFPSQSMYEGRLVADPSVALQALSDLPGVAADPQRTAPWVFVDTAGMGWEEQSDPETLSTFNPNQAKHTAREVRRLLELGLKPQDIAAITPYAAQVRLLKRLLSKAVDEGLEIGTVDGFQGREKEAVIVDLVRSNAEGAIGFLSDVRRTNVALTRAKRFLAVIGDSRTLRHHEYYRELLAAAERDGVCVHVAALV